MSWVAVAVAAVGATTAAYSADQTRKAAHAQSDAIIAAQIDDAKTAAENEVNAARAANAKIVDAKRRRQASALGLGALSDGDPLGGGSVLSSGGPAPASRASQAAGASASTSVLGSGSTGRATRPKTPTRGTAI